MMFEVNFAYWYNIIFFIIYLALATFLTRTDKYAISALMFLVGAFVMFSSGINLIFCLVPLFVGLFVVYSRLRA